MRCALSMLLNGPVYHMYEVGKNLRNGISRWSTCPLVFSCLDLGSHDLSQAEKEITACKAEKIHKWQLKTVS